MMARVPLTVDHIRTGKFVINVESVGLSPEQFFRLCGDNPELRLELTAQKEIIVMLWSASHSLNELEFKLDEYVANGAKLGFLVYPPQQQVFVYRPNQTPQCLQQLSADPADPELPGFTLDLREVR